MMAETLGMEKPARIELEILRSGAEIAAGVISGHPSIRRFMIACCARPEICWPTTQ